MIDIHGDLTSTSGVTFSAIKSDKFQHIKLSFLLPLQQHYIILETFSFLNGTYQNR